MDATAAQACSKGGREPPNDSPGTPVPEIVKSKSPGVCGESPSGPSLGVAVTNSLGVCETPRLVHGLAEVTHGGPEPPHATFCP